MINLYKQRKYFRSLDRIAKIKSYYTTILIYTILLFVIAGLNYYVNQWKNPWFLWFAIGLILNILIRSIKTFEWFPFNMKKENKNKAIINFEENNKL